MAYAQDQMDRAASDAELGLRYFDAKAWTPEQVLGAGFFVPERRFAPVDNVPHYRNLSPRVGFASRPVRHGQDGDEGVAWPLSDRVIQASANPAVNLTRSTSRNWTDTNTNYRPDCDLLNPSANGECGVWSNLSFGKANVETRYANDAQSGFNKQFDSWQGSVSVQHELRPGVNVGYFRTLRWILATDNQLVTPADFDPFCITVPNDRRLPNSGQQLCGLFDVTPTAFGLVDNLVTLASRYGKQTQVFNGVDMTVNARFAGNGQLSGGLSVGRTVTDNCYQNDDPSRLGQTPWQPTRGLTPSAIWHHLGPPELK